MPRFARRALTGAVLALAALSPAVASAQSPTLRVHAIFSGGQASNLHVGQVLDIDVRNAGGRKLTQVCMNPAPIARPACGAARNAAPSPDRADNRAGHAQRRHEADADVHDPRARDEGRRPARRARDDHMPGRDPVRQLRPFAQAVARSGRDDPPRHAGRPLQRHRARKDLHVELPTNKGGFASQSCAKTGNPS